MKFIRFAIALCCLMAVANWAIAQDAAKTPAYVGSGKCKMCHKGEKNGSIYETWLETKHAKSMESLKAKGEDKNPECLACHTTGHGTASGFGADTSLVGAEDLGAVGCEVCHGPGSEYKSKKVMESHEASLAAGMIVPNEATCTKCHNEKSPTFKGFKYDEALAKIVHKIPEKADSTAKTN
ncbi:MAG: cytochrome C554 [bacterium]|nr:cytochrome C554 [bacterium]